MGERLDVVPAAWARTHRAASQALLGSEMRALRALRATSRRLAEATTAQFVTVPRQEDRRRAATAAVVVVRAQLRLVGPQVAAAMATARLDAGNTSRERLLAEWRQLQREVRAIGLASPPGIELGWDYDPNPTAADISGHAYAAAWGSAMTSGVYAWAQRSEGTLAEVALTVDEQLDGRRRRIAATEIPRAFDDLRDDSMGWVAEHYGDAEWFPGLFKMWDAANDRVCPTCLDLDGQIRPWGVPFTGGASPGYVHNHCRCAEVTVFLPIRLPRERVPGRIVDDEHPREEAA